MLGYPFVRENHPEVPSYVKGKGVIVRRDLSDVYDLSMSGDQTVETVVYGKDATGETRQLRVAEGFGREARIYFAAIRCGALLFAGRVTSSRVAAEL